MGHSRTTDGTHHNTFDRPSDTHRSIQLFVDRRVERDFVFTLQTLFVHAGTRSFGQSRTQFRKSDSHERSFTVGLQMISKTSGHSSQTAVIPSCACTKILLFFHKLPIRQLCPGPSFGRLSHQVVVQLVKQASAKRCP